jgi:hypothetical protein
MNPVAPVAPVEPKEPINALISPSVVFLVWPVLGSTEGTVTASVRLVSVLYELNRLVMYKFLVN